MKNEYKQTLITYRLDRSKESLKAAKLLLENDMLTSAMNRIYYSMFYSIQALLLQHEASFSKHSQVKGYFNREFIKKGIFPKQFGRLFNKVFEYRQKFDYIDLVIPEKEMISEYIESAKDFNNKIEEYLQNKINNSSQLTSN